MARWHIRYGTFWAIQWSFDWWLSLGIHADLRHRGAFGPYIDVHVGPAIISLGRHPVFTDKEEAKLSFSRGGIPWP